MGQWATPEIDGTWLEGLYTGAALLLTLQTARVDVVLPYCLVCGLDNAPSFTAGPPWGAEVPPARAGNVLLVWRLDARLRRQEFSRVFSVRLERLDRSASFTVLSVAYRYTKR